MAHAGQRLDLQPVPPGLSGPRWSSGSPATPGEVPVALQLGGQPLPQRPTPRHTLCPRARSPHTTVSVRRRARQPRRAVSAISSSPSLQAHMVSSETAEKRSSAEPSPRLNAR